MLVTRNRMNALNIHNVVAENLSILQVTLKTCIFRVRLAIESYLVIIGGFSVRFDHHYAGCWYACHAPSDKDVALGDAAGGGSGEKEASDNFVKLWNST